MLSQSSENSGTVLPPLFFVTDKKRCPDPLPVIAALPPGSGVVLRDYKAKERQKLAQKIAVIARARSLVFLVGEDRRLARSLGADGVHLPEWALMKTHGKQDFDDDWLVTASVHDIRALRKAERLGADAVFLSPAFATESHPGKAPLGVHRLKKLAGQTSLPVYPLGGISEKNLKRIPRLPNMAGIAGISFFLD